MSKRNNGRHRRDDDCGSRGSQDVTIVYNGEKQTIQRGAYDSNKLREQLGVNTQCILAQLIDGEFQEVAHKVVIKGGEKFAEQQCQGGAS